jgi:hypothetical protein
MAVSDPMVLGPRGDAKVSPGNSATITVRLSEVAGTGFNDYPEVKFSSDVGTVAWPGADAFYAILPCTSLEASGVVAIPSSVAAGTLVRVRAQVGMAQMDCPDAPSIVVPIQVQ